MPQRCALPGLAETIEAPPSGIEGPSWNRRPPVRHLACPGLVPPPLTQAPSFDKTPFHPATALSLQLPSPFCHPERTRISYSPLSPATTYVVLPKENHMQLTEAATLDRKSGGAERSAVSF